MDVFKHFKSDINQIGTNKGSVQIKWLLPNGCE